MEGEKPKEGITPAAPKKRKPRAPSSHGSGHGLPIQLPFLEQIKRRNVGRGLDVHNVSYSARREGEYIAGIATAIQRIT